ncbi:MAG TPA: HD domain-containing protein [Anaerolineae bacterium]|nr:HD domain-containing protein [Anaerolineae bacterium]HMR65133.1 HD domain-containing protein [Anaerolineae bacterium]
MNEERFSEIDLQPYRERWIALVQNRVIGVGLTREEAYQAAKRTRPKDKAQLWYVTAAGQPEATAAPVTPLPDLIRWLNEDRLVSKVRAVLAHQHREAYLVGGAVRDRLLGRAQLYDLDFVGPGDGLALARHVANKLHGAFYALDETRGTGRVVIDSVETGKVFLDFASYRGETLQADLADRDFTINAIALSLGPDPRLIDPLAGQQDLARARLRAASNQALQNDPARTLRAARLAVQFGFTIEPQTEWLVRQAAARLDLVSPERKRDELIKLLNLPQPGEAVQLLRQLDLLEPLLPEVVTMIGVSQSPPHHLNVFDHTLTALEAWANLRHSHWLDLPEPLQQETGAYLSQEVAGDLSLAELMPLALLLHDTGKPLTRTESAAGGVSPGRIQFIGHERESAALVQQVMNRLRFSGQATAFVKSVVAHHMRPLLLAASPSPLSRRTIYRFFNDTHGPGFQAGLAVILHALTDHRAIYPPGQGQASEARLQAVSQQLAEAYFEQQDQVVDPPPLLSGHDLIEQFALAPGRQIGLLLAQLREAQAAGQIQDRAAALEFVRTYLNFAHQQSEDL